MRAITIPCFGPVCTAITITYQGAVQPTALRDEAQRTDDLQIEYVLVILDDFAKQRKAHYVVE